MYAILRTAKLKNQIDVSQATAHNLRSKTQPNIDQSRSADNKIIFDYFGVADSGNPNLFNERLQEYYERLGVKQKSGNVQAMEWVVSASPEFFTGKSEKQINEWAAAQLKFFQAEFGEQLKMAVLHLDEKTPHLHFVISTELKSVKNYKNKHGTTAKESWGLNAKRYNPAFLRAMQTKFAKHNERFGLRRGVPGRKRKHESLKDFYKAADRVMSTDFGKGAERALKASRGGGVFDRFLAKFGLARKSTTDGLVARALRTINKERRILSVLVGKDRGKTAETIEQDRKRLEQLQNDYTETLKLSSPKHLKRLQSQIEALQAELARYKPADDDGGGFDGSGFAGQGGIGQNQNPNGGDSPQPKTPKTK